MMQKFLSIEFIKPSFYPDEFIEGKVQLCISTQMILNEINISLFQLENWIILSSVPVAETIREPLITFPLNIKQKLNIYTNLVNLSPGTFIFPFKFKLPKDINPCFEFPTAKEKAYIRYSLDVAIVSPYINGSTSSYILFKSRPKLNKDYKNLYSSSIDVYKWNMFSEGNTTLSASLLDNENNIKYGEEIHFNVDIDNTKGKLKTNEIKVMLLRKIVFKKKLNNQIKETINNACVVQKFKAAVSPTKKQNFKFSIQLKNMDNLLFNLKDEKLPYANITDMSFFLPSINSPILECNYTLKVSLYFDSFVAYKHRPRVLIPINICHQNPYEYQPYLNSINQNININNRNYQNIN